LKRRKKVRIQLPSHKFSDESEGKGAEKKSRGKRKAQKKNRGDSPQLYSRLTPRTLRVKKRKKNWKMKRTPPSGTN